MTIDLLFAMQVSFWTLLAVFLTPLIVFSYHELREEPVPDKPLYGPDDSTVN